MQPNTPLAAPSRRVLLRDIAPAAALLCSLLTALFPTLVRFDNNGNPTAGVSLFRLMGNAVRQAATLLKKASLSIGEEVFLRVCCGAIVVCVLLWLVSLLLCATSATGAVLVYFSRDPQSTLRIKKTCRMLLWWRSLPSIGAWLSVIPLLFPTLLAYSYRTYLWQAVTLRPLWWFAAVLPTLALCITATVMQLRYAKEAGEASNGLFHF